MHNLQLHRVAAFSVGSKGGNPAGVVLLEAPMDEKAMAEIAADVGYSETAFAYPLSDDHTSWRVRYFSPQSEVPFCGHATVALGAVLGEHYSAPTFALSINNADIHVSTTQTPEGVRATLLSPPTRSQALSAREREDVLALFGLHADDVSDDLAAARIHGGADHIVIPVRDRQTLAAMTYDLATGKEIMQRHGLVTIMLVYIKDDTTFHSRNAFASGGVFEDPATGAASAAFAGYLRDVQWPHGGRITLYQGEDMGAPSAIHVEMEDTPGSPVKVSGLTRKI